MLIALAGTVVLTGACSRTGPIADPPAETPFPEITLTGVREGYEFGERCVLTATMTNSGPVALDGAGIALTYYREGRPNRIAQARIDALPPRAGRPLSLPYPCRAAIGQRALRGHMAGRHIRIVER